MIRCTHRRLHCAHSLVQRLCLLLLALALLAGCGGRGAAAPTDTPSPLPTATPTLPPTPSPPPTPTLLPTPQGATQVIPAYGFTIVNEYPHDIAAYTEGLQYVDGVLYEGTGEKGQSWLRRVELETGKVLQQHDLDAQYFGEGIVVIGDHIWQMTWQEHTAFLYDRATFNELQRVTYPTEGWGLTYDGARLIMSDGSSTLYFRDPKTFDEIGHVDVTYLGTPLFQINELEYINGEVWANVYQTNYIARINPETGIVNSVVDLTGILANTPLTNRVDVLNGIAYDAANGRLFVTGKWWPKVFEITLQQVGWAQ